MHLRFGASGSGLIRGLPSDGTARTPPDVLCRSEICAVEYYLAGWCHVTRVLVTSSAACEGGGAARGAARLTGRTTRKARAAARGRRARAARPGLGPDPGPAGACGGARPEPPMRREAL